MSVICRSLPWRFVAALVIFLFWPLLTRAEGIDPYLMSTSRALSKEASKDALDRVKLDALRSRLLQSRNELVGISWSRQLDDVVSALSAASTWPKRAPESA